MQIRPINQAANRVINAPYPPKGNNFKIIIYTKFFKGECYQKQSTFPGKNHKIRRDLLPVPLCGKIIRNRPRGLIDSGSHSLKENFAPPKTRTVFQCRTLGGFDTWTTLKTSIIMTFDPVVIPLLSLLLSFRINLQTNERK